MSSRDFKGLLVWQKAMNVARMVYSFVKKFPPEEKYGLADQMRRCAVSIPSNIAEGQQRKGKHEFEQFIGYAQGSRAEHQTQLMLAMDFGYLTEKEVEPALNELDEIGKMLFSLSKSL